MKQTILHGPLAIGIFKGHIKFFGSSDQTIVNFLVVQFLVVDLSQYLSLKKKIEQ